MYKEKSMEFLLQDRGDGGEFSTAGDIKTGRNVLYGSLFIVIQWRILL